MRRLLAALLILTATPLAGQHCDEPFAPNFFGAKPTTDTLDCDFDGSLCNWTVALGTEGTIDRFRSTSTDEQTYSLTAIPGMLTTQNANAGEDKVALRQAYTIADGESVTISLVVSTSGGENTYAFGVGLSDDPDDPLEGQWYQAFVDAELRQIYRFITVYTGRVHDNVRGQPDQTSNPIPFPLIQITRADQPGGAVRYDSWYSGNQGMTWSHFGRREFSTALPYVWIFQRIGSGYSQSANFHTPYGAVRWACLGGVGLFPWASTAE